MKEKLLPFLIGIIIVSSVFYIFSYTINKFKPAEIKVYAVNSKIKTPNEERAKIIEAGQIWVFDNDNPFEENQLKYKIIEIKNGWVKWGFVGLEDYPEVDEIKDFVRYHKILNQENK